MAEKSELNGASSGEEESSGAAENNLKKSKSSIYRQKSCASAPASVMATVIGALSPGESVFQRMNSMRQSLVKLKERSPRPKALSPILTKGQEVTPHDIKVKQVKQTKGGGASSSDPSKSADGGSPGEKGFIKRLDSVRRSLRMSKREASPMSQPLTPVYKAKVTMDSTEVTKVTERAQVSESYTLPPAPSILPSVLEVNSLIDNSDLLVAVVNLLSLRQEFQVQREALGTQASPVELAHLEKDLHLLYGALRTKMAAIVRQSSILPARNKELLLQVARVVQEEERREGEAGGLAGWREAWRGAVKDGVRDVLKAVHLDTPEHNSSWLAVHLGLLGKALLENLERVKTELQGSYPPSFRIFDEYVTAWHAAVRDHIIQLTSQVTQHKDCYALLLFIHTQYESERILGNEVLLPEMREELKSLSMDKEALKQINSKYCRQLQDEVRVLLSAVIHVERQNLWEPKAKMKQHDNAGNPVSVLVHDIAQMVAEKEKTSRTISTDLALKTTCLCLEELQSFPKQLEVEFSRSTHHLSQSDVLDQSLWVSYHIVYINSYNSLREHIESYRVTCPDQVTKLSKELEEAGLRLRETLLQHIQTDIRTFRGKLMTKQWLTYDQDFKEICTRVQTHYDLCVEMKPPLLQEFVNQLHLLVVKEYVTALLESTYSCKNRKNQQAANKLHEEMEELNQLFTDMKSTEVWLHPLGEHLSDIIGQRNESDITKKVLEPLISHFPDISEKQLVCVLNFRSHTWTPERLRIQSRLAKLKALHTPGETHRAFFTHIQ